MSGCCNNQPEFSGLSDSYKKRLWVIIALNFSMFIIEMTASNLADSQSLQADALDFLGDTLTYSISLLVIGAALHVRSAAALLKGISLLVMGAWVLGSTLYRTFTISAPIPEAMGAIGFLALAVNLFCVFLLAQYKDGDANVRSVWLCSRNDAIGNVAVIIAAIGVWETASKWPDLIVAGIMATLFVTSAIQIIRQAIQEYTLQSHT